MDMPLDELIDGHNCCQIVAIPCCMRSAENIIRHGASYGHFYDPDFLLIICNPE